MNWNNYVRLELEKMRDKIIEILMTQNTQEVKDK